MGRGAKRMVAAVAVIVVALALTPTAFGTTCLGPFRYVDPDGWPATLAMRSGKTDTWPDAIVVTAAVSDGTVPVAAFAVRSNEPAVRTTQQPDEWIAWLEVVTP